MAETTVKLSDEETRNAIAVAVAAHLTPETMRSILSDTINTMLTKAVGYGTRLTPIQQLFEEAVKKRAAYFVDQLVTGDGEVRRKLDELVREAVISMLDNPEHRERVVSNIANSVSRALAGVK